MVEQPSICFQLESYTATDRHSNDGTARERLLGSLALLEATTIRSVSSSSNAASASNRSKRRFLHQDPGRVSRMARHRVQLGRSDVYTLQAADVPVHPAGWLAPSPQCRKRAISVHVIETMTIELVSGVDDFTCTFACEVQERRCRIWSSCVQRSQVEWAGPEVMQIM